MADGTLFSGKSVEEAIADGLRSLGLTQEQVDVEIISRGSRGLFGLGSEPAQVRITPRTARPAASTPAAPAAPVAPAVDESGSVAGAAMRSDAAPSAKAEAAAPEAAPAPAKSAEPAPSIDMTQAAAKPAEASAPVSAPVSSPSRKPAPADYDEEADEEEDGQRPSRGESVATDEELEALAVELLGETVRLMGFDDAEVTATWQEPDADNDEPYLLLDIEGRDLGALIGRRGETLNNLQYLLRLMVNQRLHEWKNIVVDVQQYRQHRAQHLTQLALRSAEQVAKSGRPLSLEPMPSNERRIIHLALRDSATVFTESSGEGERRKVQILPKRS